MQEQLRAESKQITENLDQFIQSADRLDDAPLLDKIDELNDVINSRDKVTLINLCFFPL